MKNILTIAVIIFSGLIVFTSCTKNSDNVATYSMKAGVDTVAYNAPNCIAINKGGTLIIEGLSGSGSTPAFPYLSIVVAGWNNMASVFYFDNTMSDCYAQYLINDTTSELSQTGSVAISAVSNFSVKGTFYFTCTNGSVVSNGTFIAELE